MSDLCPTLRCLLALGFERRPSELFHAVVGYRFQHLDLEAAHGVNKHFRDVILLSGVLNTGRTIGLVDSEIPDDLDDERVVAAWVAMAVPSEIRDFGPVPDWLSQGVRDHHLVNLQHASSAPPQPKPVAICMIDREHARILRRGVQKSMNEQREGINVSVAFDGRVFDVTVGSHGHEALASGDAWPQRYRLAPPPGTLPVPARFANDQVPVVVYENFLAFGSRRVPIGDSLQPAKEGERP